MPLPRPEPGADALIHTSFYRFIPLAQPQQVGAVLRDLVGASTGLGGSIVVAREGINGMVAGALADVRRVELALLNEPAFEGAFAGMAFKHSACITRPFGRMKVQVGKEIVQLGVEGVDARATGTQVSPPEWRELIRQPDVVLLDNRNSFEFRLGHFEGAVDPQVTHFRDFADYVRAHAAQWKASGQRVAMYCTGGIRCEKTSAWMRGLGLHALQLEGGILNYFQQMPDAARDWRGECFVFDNRVALDTHLQETATTHEDVYQGASDAWRLQRALRLAQASGT